MISDIKQIFASLEIRDDKISCLVADCFNTRFNILACESVKSEGISEFKITDKEKVTSLIKKCLENASKKVGANIEKVILVIPSYTYKRLSLRVSLNISNGTFKKSDLNDAISNCLRADVGSDYMVINAVISKYIINGISTRRLPVGESCENAMIDVDLLCDNKEIAYDYVECVSNAGVKVLDICLDTYSICKEAVLLEQSLDKNIVLVNVGLYHSSLTILSKGKIANTEIIYDGLHNLIKNVYENYHINYDTLLRLVKYNTDFETNYVDDSVYAWSENNENKSISINDLNNIVKVPLNILINKISTMCKPIIEQGQVEFVVVGDGANMSALIKELQIETKCSVQSYYPDTIGVRNSDLCSLFGSFVVYKEKAYLLDKIVNCINQDQFSELIKNKDIDSEGETITTKIKNLFEKYKNGEESK